MPAEPPPHDASACSLVVLIISLAFLSLLRRRLRTSTITASELRVPADGLTCDVTSAGVIYLRWPGSATYPTFASEYARTYDVLSAATKPYGIVHDVRGADLCSIQRSMLMSVAGDAVTIATLGMVQRAALVLDRPGPMLRTTIALFVQPLCPVPLRIFADDAPARAWAACATCPSDASAPGAGAAATTPECDAHEIANDPLNRFVHAIMACMPSQLVEAPGRREKRVRRDHAVHDITDHESTA